MVYRALLIGIDYTGTLSALSGCVSDMFYVKSRLNGFYSRKNIQIREYHDRTTTSMPSRSNIISGIEWLVSDCKAGDHLFIYYSGHGGNVFDIGGDESDSRDETIVAFDGNQLTHFTDDDLWHYLIQPLVKGVTLTAMFDTCSSGTILDLSYSYRPKPQIGKYQTIHHTGRPPSPARVILISGCLDSQSSYEMLINGRYRGVMTTAYFIALSLCYRWKRYHRQRGRHVNIRYDHMFNNIVKHIRKYGIPQTPQISAGNSSFKLRRQFTVM